jgi:hypothetical protein
MTQTMTQNVSNTIDFNSMKDMSTKQIQKHIVKNAKTYGGLDKDGKEKLVQFMKTEPGSEERSKILTPSTPVETKKETLVQPTVQVDSQKPVETPVPAAELPKADETADVKPNSELQELMEKLSKATEESKKHRQGASRVGNELEKLRKEKEDLEKKFEELSKTKAQVIVSNTENEPDEPDIDKYPDGFLSDEYQADFKKYQKDLKAYFKNQVQDVKTQSVKEMEKRLSEIQAQTSQTLEAANEYRTDKTQISSDMAWNKLWKKAADIQDKVGLKTSVDPKIINDMATIIRNPANYTTEQVNAASDAITKVDKVSMDNFNQLSNVIQNMYEFPNGIPVEKSVTIDDDDDLKLAVSLKKAGINKPIIKQQSNREMIESRAADEQKTEGYVRAMPASEIGSNDPNITNQLTRSEEVNKLKAMADRTRKQPSLLSDQKFMEEFTALRRKLNFL